MTIQTVIVERDPEDTLGATFFLEESPEVVKASILSESPDVWRTVYSFEEYVKMQTRPLSNFCPAPRGIWWLAVDINELLRQMPAGSNHAFNIGCRELNEVKHFHVTLDYNATYEDNPHCAWAVEHGETSFSVYVKGLAYNDKCAALVVRLDSKAPDCCNKVAHITLALAEGIAPVYSNDMLAGVDGAYNFLPLEAELEGTLEFFEFSCPSD